MVCFVFSIYVEFVSSYFFSYSNLDRPTIELELFKALRKVNLIDDEDVKKPGEKLNFQRAARTDKNVSALKQMCSLKLPREQDKNLPNLVETMKNEHLPETIRIWGTVII